MEKNFFSLNSFFGKNFWKKFSEKKFSEKIFRKNFSEKVSPAGKNLGLGKKNSEKKRKKFSENFLNLTLKKRREYTWWPIIRSYTTYMNQSVLKGFYINDTTKQI